MFQPTKSKINFYKKKSIDKISKFKKLSHDTKTFTIKIVSVGPLLHYMVHATRTHKLLSPLPKIATKRNFHIPTDILRESDSTLKSLSSSKN